MTLLLVALRIVVAFIVLVAAIFAVWQMDNYMNRKIDQKYKKK